jgi:hypothetical protein
MPLGLGNNLIRSGGSLNPDGLSLDLQFAADKTLTARKGPTPAFTRGSGATQVGATGLIEYAPENLILYSNNVADAAWTKADGTITSSAETINGLTAEVFNENSANAVHRFFRMHDGFAGVISTFSVWLKAAGRRYVSVNLGANGPNTNSKLVLDLVDRVVIAGTTGVTTSILLENNGWARYSFTFVPRVNSGSMPIQSNFSSTVVSENGVGLNGAAFYVAGQQYERASIARAYIPTTTAAVYGPRFDHDPVTLASRGLLIEEGRTNLLTQSESWQTGASFTGPSAPTVTLDTTNAPDGALTADTLTGSTGTATDGSVTSTWRLPTVSSSTAYTFSIYVRSLGIATKAEIRIRDNSTGASAQTLDTTLTSSWKRLSVTATTGSTTTSIRCIIQNTDGPIAIWGAQLEAGSFPTSYIPTTTGTLARGADMCSITGGDFSGIWNGADATMFFRGSRIANQTGQTNWDLSSGTSATSIASDRGATTERIVANAVGIMATSAFSTLAEYKTAAALKTSDYAVSFNGASAITSSSAFVLTLDRMTIGMTRNGAGHINGWVHSLRLYKKRLPNAKLQALTV